MSRPQDRIRHGVTMVRVAEDAVPVPRSVAAIASKEDVAVLLRHLRRRQARAVAATPLTYRELAARTGWAIGTISDYFTGKVLAPTDRFDVLVQLLGASPAEQGVLATVRDRVEERQRRRPVAAGATAGEAAPAASLPGAGSPGGFGPIVPRQLPTPAWQFVGRAREFAALTRLAEQATTGTSTAVVALIDGSAGVGKTALALSWAHQDAQRFGDGQLYVNLRGFDRTGEAVTASEALGGFLLALEVPAQRIPAELANAVGAGRTVQIPFKVQA